MHVHCHDITYDVIALINDIMSENKMMHFRRSASEAHFQKNCLKTAVEPREWYTRIAGWSV